MPHLVVRRMDGTEVHRVEVKGAGYEKVLAGMLRNMDTERFYVDDSDFDEKKEDR